MPNLAKPNDWKQEVGGRDAQLTSPLDGTEEVPGCNLPKLVPRMFLYENLIFNMKLYHLFDYFIRPVDSSK